jgi:hypothetical protein
MTSRSSSRLAIVVAVVFESLVAPGGVLAQSSLRNGCEDCAVSGVSVPRPSVDVLRQAAATEGARLAIALSTTSQPQPQQRRGWIGRHPILGGALIGAAAGFAFGAVALGGEPFIGPDPLDPFTGGLVVMPAGAYIGTITGTAVWLIRR